jgi:hypothetical protein
VREYCEDKCYSQGLQRDIKIKTNKRKEEWTTNRKIWKRKIEKNKPVFIPCWEECAC